jgi:hypothetical protein
LYDRKRVEKQIKDVQDKSDVLRSEVSYLSSGKLRWTNIESDNSNTVRSSATSCATPSCSIIDNGAMLALIIALHGVRFQNIV